MLTTFRSVARTPTSPYEVSWNAAIVPNGSTCGDCAGA